MRSVGGGLALALALLAAGQGRAQLAVPPADQVRAAPPPRRAPATLGLALDAGLPAGISLGLAWRPSTWARVEAGAAHNLAGLGVQGGVALTPLEGTVAPILAVDVGYFFDGDVRRFARTILGVREDGLPRSLAYAFANAHVGIEARHGDLTVFLRGGYGLVSARTSRSGRDTGDGIRFEEPAHALVLGPSGKLGVILYVL